MTQRTPILRKQQQLHELELELSMVKQALVDVEGKLAAEQAAVNAFRMHCRLTIGPWVDHLLDLRGEGQGLLTQVRLLRQELGLPLTPMPTLETVLDGQAVDDADLPPLPEPVAEMVETIARDRVAEKRLYRELARRFHPDMAAQGVERGYATSIMAAVNVAYERGDVRTLRELAGEPDPTAVSRLQQIEDPDIRRLRRQVMTCQRRQRKVAQQLRAQRQEYTAQLWRKAEQLNTADEQNWWDEIQQVLVQEIGRLETAVVGLRDEAAALAVRLEEEHMSIDD